MSGTRVLVLNAHSTAKADSPGGQRLDRGVSSDLCREALAGRTRGQQMKGQMQQKCIVVDRNHPTGARHRSHLFHPEITTSSIHPPSTRLRCPPSGCPRPRPRSVQQQRAKPLWARRLLPFPSKRPILRDCSSAVDAALGPSSSDSQPAQCPQTCWYKYKQTLLSHRNHPDAHRQPLSRSGLLMWRPDCQSGCIAGG
jgi:hypothetical protein